MSCTQSPPEVTKTLTAPAGTATEEYFTEWQSGMGVDFIRMTLKVSNMSASALWYQPVIQTARVRVDKPNAPATLDVARTTVGEFCTGDKSVVANTEGQMFFRLGIQFKINSGTTLAKADVAFQAAFNQCGSIAGNWSGHLEATTTDERTQPVTGWMLATEAEKVMAALVIGSMTGAFQLMFTWRTALASPESPSAWNAVNQEAAWHTINEETTTAQLTTAASANMWIQFGVKYKIVSGTFGQADVAVTTCVRRA